MSRSMSKRLNENLRNKIHGKKYTEKQWTEEMALSSPLSSLGSCLRCPNCKTLGFYGPRVVQNNKGEITRKYKACKFCGFWQEAWGDVYNERGGEAYRCITVLCDKCGAYDWRVPWSKQLGNCINCGNANIKQAEWASNDQNHPFHKLKEKIIEK